MQLSKEQIEAVAEWIKANGSTFLFHVDTIAEKFKKDFALKESTAPKLWNMEEILDFLKTDEIKKAYRERFNRMLIFGLDFEPMPIPSDKITLDKDVVEFIEKFSEKHMESNKNKLPKITDLTNTKIWVENNPQLFEKIVCAAEKLGWNADGLNCFKNKPENFLMIHPDGNIIILLSRTGTCLFDGKIKNKSELKRLMKQLEI